LGGVLGVATLTVGATTEGVGGVLEQPNNTKDVIQRKN
jgi:hypothetical protein